jgi:hypothetical protein
MKLVNGTLMGADRALAQRRSHGNLAQRGRCGKSGCGEGGVGKEHFFARQGLGVAHWDPKRGYIETMGVKCLILGRQKRCGGRRGGSVVEDDSETRARRRLLGGRGGGGAEVALGHGGKVGREGDDDTRPWRALESAGGSGGVGAGSALAQRRARTCRSGNLARELGLL